MVLRDLLQQADDYYDDACECLCDAYFEMIARYVGETSEPPDEMVKALIEDLLSLDLSHDRNWINSKVDVVCHVLHMLEGREDYPDNVRDSFFGARITCESDGDEPDDWYANPHTGVGYIVELLDELLQSIKQEKQQ